MKLGIKTAKTASIWVKTLTAEGWKRRHSERKKQFTEAKPSNKIAKPIKAAKPTKVAKPAKVAKPTKTVKKKK